MKLAIVVLSLALSLVGLDAQAKRLGGGRSIGQQSGQVTQREAVKPAPTAPAAAPAAAVPRKPWGAMLGGLAAGLGLAWLANSLGLGEVMAQFMLFALLALVLMVAVGWWLRRRQTTRGAAAGPGSLAYQGAAPMPRTPASYRPEHVGNDASARPWERNSQFFDAGRSEGTPPTGSLIGSGLRGTSATWGVPHDFDTEGFLKAAKANFVSLQSAWDRSDIPALRAMMTDAMLREIQAQLAEREAHTGGPLNQTDVVMLDAQLLGIEDLGEGYLASVEFSGLIREEPSAGPNPFREVWNMTKTKDGRTGWLVAGVQALQ